MAGIFDAKAELRGAIRRLTKAAKGEGVDVTVKRVDLFVLMSYHATKLGTLNPMPMPNLHPSQQ